MDLFDAPVCRLCLGNRLSLVGIYESSIVNIAEILNKHIGEVHSDTNDVCGICSQFSPKMHRETFISNHFTPLLIPFAFDTGL